MHHGVPDIGVSNLAMENTDMKNIEVLKDFGDITYPRVRSHQRTGYHLKTKAKLSIASSRNEQLYVAMT